jgi:hypothetical protein
LAAYDQHERLERLRAASCGPKNNEVALVAVADFLDATPFITNADLRRYVVKMVFEIDGSPGYYDELMQAFESAASEADLIAYAKS